MKCSNSVAHEDVITMLAEFGKQVTTLQEELRKREELIESVYRVAPVGIGVVVDRVIQEANRCLCKMTGYERSELLGKNARMLYPSEEEYQLVGQEKYSQIRVTGTGSVETKWRRKSGEVIDVLLSSTALDPGNLALGVTFTALDITGLRRAERERLEMERSLFHAQKLESLGVLAGGIAHDFNNLLMVILGNLDMAMLTLSPASPVRSNLQQAIIASQRAADLTRQMLAYSGKGQFVLRRLNLSRLVAENADILTTSVAKKAVLNLHLAGNLPQILADPGQVQQVIMNLITNAAESLTSSEGEVSLTNALIICTEADLASSLLDEKPSPGRFVSLEVTDNGCGMDEMTRQRLFDPFFSTKFTGRGLGMAAVLGIVRAHRGAIFVDSAVGRGTTVQVLFPEAKTEEPADAVHHQVSASPRKEMARRVFSRGTALVVDDEEMVRNLSKAMLEQLDFRVIAAADGREAVRQFRRHADQIAFVLLDLTMPKMDGQATFLALREIRAGVKVILSSGYNEQEATQYFAGQGLAAFIQKPYQLQSLQEKVEKVLSS